MLYKAPEKLNFVIVDPSLRSSGVLVCRDGNVSTYAIQKTETDRLFILGWYVRHFANLAIERKWDFLCIEDYAFSPTASRSVTVQAEIGGVIRSAFATSGIPIIEIPIQTWKIISGIRLPKASAKDKREYKNAVIEKYHVEMDTIDETDAFLMLMTLSKISRGVYDHKSKGAIYVREKLEEMRIEI